MPLYRVRQKNLDALVEEVEARSEVLVQAIRDAERIANNESWFTVITNVPVNDTGFAWAPGRSMA